MILLKKEENYLLKCGYLKEDIIDIKNAKYQFETYDEKRISAKEVRDILGSEEFASGLGRSCFHCSAVRNGVDERNEKTAVYFINKSWGK